MSTEKPLFLSVVIPAYNEAGRISGTLHYIAKFLRTQHYLYEIMVVSDGSTDDTAELVTSLHIPHCRLLSYPYNRGKGFAVNYGMTKAKGQYRLFCDADNATSFEQVQILLELAKAKQTDVVIGSRHLNESTIMVQQSFTRRLAASLGNWLIQALLLPGIADTQCGFKLFSAKVAEDVFARQTIWGWGFDIEILYIAKLRGYSIKELQVHWMNKAGSRIQSPLVYVDTLFELLRIKLKSMLGRYR